MTAPPLLLKCGPCVHCRHAHAAHTGGLPPWAALLCAGRCGFRHMRCMVGGMRPLLVDQSNVGASNRTGSRCTALAYASGNGMRLHAGSGLGGGGYFIVMEYLDFSGRPSQRELGRGLARMHLAEPSVRACFLHAPPSCASTIRYLLACHASHQGQHCPCIMHVGHVLELSSTSAIGPPGNIS
jgi:hypothetical protein